MRRRTHTGTPGATAGDRHWRGDARYAVRCALLFYGLAIVLDAGAGTLTLYRAGLWTVLAALVLAVVLPPRVRAGEGWLAVRGVLHERRVRIDALTEVRQYEGIPAHLLLRDVDGR